MTTDAVEPQQDLKVPTSRMPGWQLLKERDFSLLVLGPNDVPDR